MLDFPSAPVRRARRASATIPMGLSREMKGSMAQHDACVVDLSHLGARIRSTFVLSPGEIIGVNTLGDSGHPIRSRVVWVERSSVDCSLAGVEFLARISHHVFREWLAQTSEPCCIQYELGFQRRQHSARSRHDLLL